LSRGGTLRGWRSGRWGKALAALCCGVLGLLLLPGAAFAAFDAHGSVEQVYATGVNAGAKVTLYDGGGDQVAVKNADNLGAVLFREISPGGGYRLEAGGQKSGPLQVLTTRSPPPSTDLYKQQIPASGYGYLTTRDGTRLAIDVHPPTDVTNVLPTPSLPGGSSGGTVPGLGLELPKIELPGLELPEIGKVEVPKLPLAKMSRAQRRQVLAERAGGGARASALPSLPTVPTPTLVEYSGYGYANPEGPESGISLIANLMGFTVVDVNMRGTGCSGGAYDFFEPLQSLDGYDVVETIAHQPWALHHEVGMMGISYGGISQLFTAATQPPSLAAITPLSVLDNTQTTLYPGGILNTGFALEWAKERVHDAEAAGPNSGQAWAYKRVQEGDRTCAENQALHPEAVNLLKKVEENSHYQPKVADPLAPITFVNKIGVPTFMACQWTDEQTGGHCPTLAEHMTGTKKKWFTFTNGTHIDSLDPETFNRWVDFLELYVAKQPPAVAGAITHAGAPLIYQEAMGISGLTLPPDPAQLQPTYQGALAAFEAQKPIRVLFDNGAGGSSPGQPYPSSEASFDKFPVPGTKAKTWYLRRGGKLGDKAPGKERADGFTWDAHATSATDFSGDTAGGAGGLWTATPEYHWQQNPAGSAVSYLTAPLAQTTTVIGAGAVNVWVRSSSPNVDLQATVSEVRPDGNETFVQNGWVRGNERKLDAAKSTPLEPVLSLRESDVSPLPADHFVKVTVPLYYEGHAYRAGSRIRVTISAPNGSQPIWAFADADPQGTAKVAIAYGGEAKSSLTLPVVSGVGVAAALPPCPGLRGEPCRPYVALKNRSAKP
jgi:predicted acyl esterase